MSVIALASGKGAPGVTTAAVGLALHWPRPVLLIEADLAGSSILSGYFRGHIAHDRGLRELAIVHSHGEFDRKLTEQMMPLSETDSTKRFLPGILSPQETPALLHLWPDLTRYLVALDRSGIDVLVDLGRIGGVADPREVLIRLADQVVLCTSSRMPDIVIARGIASQALPHDVASQELSNMSLLVIGPGQPYQTREISSTVGLPALGDIAWDPETAAVFSAGAKPPRKYGSSPLVKSLLPIIDQMGQRIATRRSRLSTQDHT